MDAVQAFKWWVSVGKHFRDKNHDVIKVRDHIRGSYAAIVTRNDYHFFESIVNLFDGKKREYIMFLVANNMYGFKDMIYDTVTGVENYNTFVMRLRYLSNIVESDFYKISRQCRKPTQPVDVLRLLTGGDIAFETCVVINKLRPKYFRKIEGTPIFSIVEPLIFRIEKSAPFVVYDDSKRANFERLIDKLKLFC